ncbi:MAG: hypothetical protein U9Q77_04245 [Candidatus Marinimicrobia bacterium]|nr:hypothetical protein [Candidatus Neomarinimicrobiota bacterium]
MPFQFSVEYPLDIVIGRVVGEGNFSETFGEIKKSIITKQGEGITRRLYDFQDSDFFFDIDKAIQLVNIIQHTGKMLNSKKIALLFQEIPETFDLEQLAPHLESEDVSIGIFIEQAKAVEFLNQK